MKNKTPHAHIQIAKLISMTDDELYLCVVHPDGMLKARIELQEMLGEGQLFFVLDPACKRQSDDGQCSCHKKPRDCNLCGDSRAVGKYFIHKSESENHGWVRVCNVCAPTVERVGAKVDYYKYTQEFHDAQNPTSHLPQHIIECEHQWEKWSNVGEVDKYRKDMFDWYRCEQCKVYGKKFGIGVQPIIDLMMEIDLSCCR